MNISILRDTDFSFVKTTINKKGNEFSRKLEEGSIDYASACSSFHQQNVLIKIGNKVQG
jgi:hypothetical protein